MILKYLLEFHLQDCLNIIAEKDNLGYFSVKIDFLKLFETYPDVGDSVLCNPIESLPACNRDIIKVQQNLLEQDEYKHLLAKLDYCHLKRNVQARFFSLPVCPELHRTVFPKSVDLGCFLKVTGTSVRVTQSKILEYKRKYVCVKCKYENIIEAHFEKRYILKAPNKCSNDDIRCKCTNFTQVKMVSREHCKDYQEVKIQEQANKLSVGTIPGSMWVVLENDLVDSCKPGDDVNICGTVRSRWRPPALGKRSEVDLVLEANSIEVCNAQRSKVIASAPDVKVCFDEYWTKYEACPVKGRDRILASVCPQVYGLHLAKLAVLLTVITGSDHAAQNEEEKQPDEDQHTDHVRGQCHLLLVGDPGTGKSQLLRAASDLSARSVLTSGACSTRAGLTCAALREEGEWQLEAGALVLSDGGVCCIDEIAQLRDHDRAAIHEAMEQQTISIAKAGIVCKLNTRCAVIAACNPKGHYRQDEPLSTNVALGTPLLSRFDLIFILLDKKNREWDDLVASYILHGRSLGADSKNQWNLEKLQMYISLVGPRPTEMTRQANTILQSYYMMQRKSLSRDPSRTTVRMLDSLVRLSQAHCRLMYRSTISAMDAIVAVSLVDLSMQDCTLNNTTDALHSISHKCPDFEYLCTAKQLLSKMYLYEIWQQELIKYGKLLGIDHKTLELEIEKRSTRYFEKFNDVSDDSIPLSSTVITSSYFNGNKDQKAKNLIEGNENKEDDDKVNKVSDGKAEKLTKNAILNKKQIKAPTGQKKATYKRKLKEVTVDTSDICKNAKKSRKSDAKSEDKTHDSEIISDSEEESKPTKRLNALPSVSDFFADLDIDLEFNDNPEKDTVNQEIKNRGINFVNRHSTQKDCEPENYEVQTSDKKEAKKFAKNHEISKKEESLQDLNTSSSRTIDKLKRYKYTGKHDLSKYDKEHAQDKSKSKADLPENTSHLVQKTLSHENNVVQLKNSNCSSNSSSVNMKSIPSSQISMFESSDFDIDADIDLV